MLSSQCMADPLLPGVQPADKHATGARQAQQQCLELVRLRSGAGGCSLVVVGSQEKQVMKALRSLEMPLVRVLADMETLGVTVNMQHLHCQQVCGVAHAQGHLCTLAAARRLPAWRSCQSPCMSTGGSWCAARLGRTSLTAPASATPPAPGGPACSLYLAVWLSAVKLHTCPRKPLSWWSGCSQLHHLGSIPLL